MTRITLVLVLAAVAGGCATPEADPQTRTQDTEPPEEVSERESERADGAQAREEERTLLDLPDDADLSDPREIAVLYERGLYRRDDGAIRPIDDAGHSEEDSAAVEAEAVELPPLPEPGEGLGRIHGGQMVIEIEGGR